MSAASCVVGLANIVTMYTPACVTATTVGYTYTRSLRNLGITIAVCAAPTYERRRTPRATFAPDRFAPARFDRALPSYIRRAHAPSLVQRARLKRRAFLQSLRSTT